MVQTSLREDGREQRKERWRDGTQMMRSLREKREERREKREQRDKHDQDKWVKDAMVRSQNGGMVKKRVGP